MAGADQPPVERLRALAGEQAELLARLAEVRDAEAEARLEDGGLIVDPVAAGGNVDESRLRKLIEPRLPEVDLADLLIEVDGWTGFTRHLVPLSGNRSRSGELPRVLYAAIVAQAMNLGLTGLARASQFSYQQLEWAWEQYCREPTLTAASREPRRLPLPAPARRGVGHRRALLFRRTAVRQPHPRPWHGGAAALLRPPPPRASDLLLDLGSVQPVRQQGHRRDRSRRDAHPGRDPRQPDRAADRRAHHRYPRLHRDDLRRLRSPRPALRAPDPRPGPPTALPPRCHAGRRDGRAAQAQASARTRHPYWDQLLRLAASLRHGWAPASLLLSRLQAGSRRNPLAQALQEYGRLVKTNFVLGWLGDEELRARIGRQLNKGEQLHALRRAVFYANEGHLRQRTPEQQAEQALCLSIVCNAIIAWNTVYIQRVLDELLAAGELITTSEIERISPLAHQHIHLYGHYPFDLATRPTGHRPLRTPVEAPPTPAPKTLNGV